MLSFLTLNLRFGLADDGSNSWRFRKKCLPYLFQKHYSDFIGFQEANNFQIDFLNKILVDYNFVGKRDPAPSFWQNNIIFYKKEWKCIYYEHFFLSPTPNIPSRDRNSRWPRQFSLGRFKKKEEEIFCINTHFDFDKSVQIKSAKIILKRLSNFSNDIPAVMVGDFNADPSSAVYKIFNGVDQTIFPNFPEKYFFKNAFKKPFPASYHGFTGNTGGDHIDWILYRGNLVPNKSYVIQDPINGIFPSDHFPLYAQFKLNSV